MRGQAQAQPAFLTVIGLNQRVPADHPLRGIKERVDQVLRKLSPVFDVLYTEGGRPSIPPEQLLKSRILMAPYSVRSERLFCEQLAYNLLWPWFLDRELDEGSFDPAVFTHNYERVLSAEAPQLFFAEVYDLSQQEGWTSHQHVTADATLIEASASLKSFVRRGGNDPAKVRWARDDDLDNPTNNFHGDPLRPQAVEEVLALTARLDVLQAPPAGENVVGQVAQSAFVDEDGSAPLLACLFFIPGHRASFHCWMATSFRWMARPVGRWQPHPRERRIRQTWPGWNVRLVWRSIKSATRVNYIMRKSIEEAL